MKNKIGLLIVVLLCFCACKHKADDVAGDAKKIAADINRNLKDYTTKHVDDLTSADPGTITGYYREEEVKKIYAENFGKDDRTFTDFYFDEGMLVYVQVQDYVYNKPTTYTETVARQNNDSEWYDDKKTKLVTSSYYFENNKLVKGIEEGREISPADADFADKESHVLAQALILIKELKEE